MLVDTHCHLNTIVKKEFDIPLKPGDFDKAAEIINEASADSVTILLNVGTSLEESLNSYALAQRFIDVYAAVGIHPTDLKDDWKKELNQITNLITCIPERDSDGASKAGKQNKIVAIGECGIDLYHTQNLAEQEEAFKRQIDLALEHDLGLVVHSRNAPDETLNVLSQVKNSNLRGVIHCFSYDLTLAKEFIKLGFVLGIGGTITYPKNDELRNVVTSISLTDIILETDAPFLPPQIIRGKPNHPKYIKVIAQFISGLKNLTLDEVAKQTTENAFKIFRFKAS